MDQSHGGIPAGQIKNARTEVQSQKHYQKAQSTHNDFSDDNRQNETQVVFGHIKLQSPADSKYQSQILDQKEKRPSGII